MNMEIGGISVVGLAAGEHYLVDIQVVVPYRVLVHIPAEKALRSKDLYRAISQQLIFKLDGGTGYVQQVQGKDPVEVSILKQENESLKQENERLKRELTIAQNQLTQLKQNPPLQGQMDSILAALGRLEAAPKVIHQMAAPGTTASVLGPDTGVVGGEVPMFIPDATLPSNAEVRLNIQQTVGTDSVTGAASRLKDLRKGNKG